MPYKDHTPFEVEDWSQDIWRYLDIQQFLSILETGSLWFSRSDLFDDPSEGRLPDQNVKELGPTSKVELPEYLIIRGENRRLASRGAGEINRRTDWPNVNKRSAIKAYRRSSFANCWHQKDDEKDPLWRANLNGSDGVVIKSTARRLRESLSVFDANDVYIGEIKYINYNTDRIPTVNLLYPFTYKRKGFAEENELRAVVTTFPTGSYPERGLEGTVPGQPVSLDWDDHPFGFYVEVDLNKLIEEVRISPTSPSWLKRTLRETVSRFERDIKIKDSDLAFESEQTRWESV